MIQNARTNTKTKGIKRERERECRHRERERGEKDKVVQTPAAILNAKINIKLFNILLHYFM